jgi:3-phytase
MFPLPSFRCISVCCAWALLGACAAPDKAPVDNSAGARLVERYTTMPAPVDNIDSVVTWLSPDGATWLFASAKDADNLVVFDADTGANLRRVGSSGTAPGQFERPNGIAVIDDLLFVVERDNHRVQVLSLPALAPVLIFGAAELRVPYGLWIERAAPGELGVYVTDSYQMADGAPPPLEQLAERVKHYRLSWRDGQMQAQHVASFGDTSASGALRWVESIYGDPSHGRMLIAEEYLESGSTLRVYDMSGNYLGIDLDPSHFDGQAEGIALWNCADGSGYWVATDQRDDGNRFQVFDRATLRHLGSFSGRNTRNTDGIHLQSTPTKAFPHGVFFAVHDDQAVSAFDWRDIAGALRLREECP